jgi:hypothetical protein
MSDDFLEQAANRKQDKTNRKEMGVFMVKEVLSKEVY